jgi:metalloprotease
MKENNMKRVIPSVVLVMMLAGCETMAPLGGLSGSGGAGRITAENAQGAVSDLVKASTITDADVRSMASNFAKQSDQENQVAAPNSVYAKRLVKLTNKLVNYDGMRLDFKVYMSDTVNAFAMADGTVRVYSGLMDLMTDDELRFVIGHEIAHVKLGHSMASIKNAYQSSAMVKGGAALAATDKTGNVVMGLAGEQLKGIFTKVLTSAHSRSQETDADAYSVKFLKTNKISTKAASTALLKLAGQSGARSATLMSSHPDPKDRAEAVEKLATAN